MFTINEDNKCHRRSWHKQITIHLSRSQKLTPEDWSIQTRIVQNMERVSVNRLAEVSWEGTGKLGAFGTSLLLPMPTDADTSVALPTHISTPIHPLPNEEPHWSACSAFPIQWIGFPSRWVHCSEEQHESLFSLSGTCNWVSKTSHHCGEAADPNVWLY